jgi:hypothetical protein
LAKYVIDVVIVTVRLLLIVLVCDSVDVIVKYDAVGIGDFDDDNVRVWAVVLLGYEDADASTDNDVCGDPELLCVVEPDSEKTCVFVLV